MKKFINDPLDLTSELLEGMAIAHSDTIAIGNAYGIETRTGCGSGSSGRIDR